MSKSTSAPWIYCKSNWDDCYVIRHDGVHGNGHLRTFTADATDEANARLVCAAPEMLAALQGTMRTMILHHGDFCKCEECRDARLAIAKATGEDPDEDDDRETQDDKRLRRAENGHPDA